MRFEEPRDLRRRSRLALRVTRLGDTESESSATEVVFEGELARSARGELERFVGLADGFYLFEVETDTGQRGSRRQRIDTSTVVRAVGIQLE